MLTMSVCTCAFPRCTQQSCIHTSWIAPLNWIFQFNAIFYRYISKNRIADYESDFFLCACIAFLGPSNKEKVNKKKTRNTNNYKEKKLKPNRWSRRILENDEWLEIYNVEMKLLEFSVCKARITHNTNSIPVNCLVVHSFAHSLHNAARFLYGNDYHFRLEILLQKRKKSENGVNEWMQEVCEKERKMCMQFNYI